MRKLNSSDPASVAGFSLIEMVMALGILAIVGLGAMTVLTGTVESQNKLERILSRGFTHLSYNPKGFPMYRPELTYITKPGWFRVPSPNAIDPQTRTQLGSEVNDTVTVRVSNGDLASDIPEWALCKGDEAVQVECSHFQDGMASIRFKQNQMKPPPAAIARVRIKWPSLHETHPNKYSPEYVITIPYIRDCEVEPLTPGGQRYLEHAVWQIENQNPGNPDPCKTIWLRSRCLNGHLKRTTFGRNCK